MITIIYCHDKNGVTSLWLKARFIILQIHMSETGQRDWSAAQSVKLWLTMPKSTQHEEAFWSQLYCIWLSSVLTSLGKQQKMVQVQVEPKSLLETPKVSLLQLRLLTSALPDRGCCIHLGIEQADRKKKMPIQSLWISTKSMPCIFLKLLNTSFTVLITERFKRTTIFWMI